jgi:hypothetical protein
MSLSDPDSDSAAVPDFLFPTPTSLYTCTTVTFPSVLLLIVLLYCGIWFQRVSRRRGSDRIRPAWLAPSVSTLLTCHTASPPNLVPSSVTMNRRHPPRQHACMRCAKLKVKCKLVVDFRMCERCRRLGWSCVFQAMCAGIDPGQFYFPYLVPGSTTSRSSDSTNSIGTVELITWKKRTTIWFPN